MKNIFITGDSFCVCREDENHWPFRLAQNLKLNLTGEGFSGRSWWECRKLLNIYRKKYEFHNTEYFIFCHTDVSRPVNLNYEISWRDNNHPNYYLYEIYIKYFYEPDFMSWAFGQYILELNRVLHDKRVIHILCFDGSPEQLEYLKTADGIIITTDLLSLTDHGTQGEFWQRGANHFSGEMNIWLAEKLYDLCVNYDLNKNQQVSLTK